MTAVLVPFAAALSMGFLGSLHCAGMCGPIMMVMPFRFYTGWKKAAGIALYHTGRITVYAGMGLTIHSFRSLFNAGVQQYISVVLGAFLLLAGICSFAGAGHSRMQLPWMNFVRRQTGRFIANLRPEALFVAGMLNGLLPCGLVYMALSLAVTADSGLHAAGLMYAFGAGTVPMLVALTLMGGKVRLLSAPNIRKFVPVAMLAFGALFLFRGMNLGIPYLSPKVKVVNGEVSSSCCQRP
jgi:sulfite exporter TauE/SafE